MSEQPEYDVFLSHNSEEKPSVKLLADRLANEAALKPFLDMWHLAPGKSWISELEKAIDASGSVAVFFGPSGKSAWHNEEMQRALIKAAQSQDEFRVIPVLLPGANTADIGAFLAARTWVDFRPGLEDVQAFDRLVKAIKGEAFAADGFQLPAEPAPYVGLRAFDSDEARFFFGREPEIQRLVDKLQSSQFVAVVGASGSGKSSLVRAGLLPRLNAERVCGWDEWCVLQVLPGTQPLHALARQVVRHTRLESPQMELDFVDRFVGRLQAQDDGLRSALPTLIGDAASPILIFVDQFEELFTNAERPEEPSSDASRFIANIADVIASEDRRYHLVITLRADFIPRCLESGPVRQLLETQQLLVGNMDETAIRDAIVRPAREVGAFFEKGLVRLILQDLGDPQGALPLLEHSLYELWEARRGPWFTHEAYENLGGVRGALRRRADLTFKSLTKKQRAIAREVMLRLTHVGDVAVSRRRAVRDELYLSGVTRQSVDEVIDVLAGSRARLVIADGRSVVVAHDALYREWDELRSWLEADREAVRLRNDLTQSARQWERNEQAAEYLWMHRRLRKAVVISKEGRLQLAEKETEFLDASRVAARREAMRKVVVPSAAVTLVLLTLLISTQIVTYYRGIARPGIALSQLDINTVEGKRTADRVATLRAQLEDAIPNRRDHSKLLIATWSLRDFGDDTRGYGRRLEESIYYIAEIVSHFDLVAVQEVRELDSIRRVVELLGPHWRLIHSDVTEGAAGNRERLAFLFDTRKVQHADYTAELVLPAERRPDGIRIREQPARTPYLSGFRVGEFRFTLCNVHIYYGAESGPARQRRIEELRGIAELLSKQAARAWEWSPNIILLGTFNAPDEVSPELSAVEEFGFVLPEPIKATASNLSTSIPRPYDQIALHFDTPALALFEGEGGSFDYTETVVTPEDEAIYAEYMGDRYFKDRQGDPTPAGSKSRYYLQWRTYQISDHLPKWIAFNLNNYGQSAPSFLSSDPEPTAAEGDPEPPGVADAASSPPDATAKPVETMPDIATAPAAPSE